MDAQLIKITGLAAGVLTSAAMIPQLVKIIRNRRADDVSPLLFIMLIAGTALWTFYGVLRDDLPIIITNAFSFLLNTVTLILGLRYSKKGITG